MNQSTQRDFGGEPRTRGLYRSVVLQFPKGSYCILEYPQIADDLYCDSDPHFVR